MDEQPPELNVVMREGNNVVATCQNLVLAVWGQASSAGPMRAIHHAHLELLRHHTRVGHLAIINHSKLPNQEAREAATEFNRESRMTSIAVVVDGDGFWLSAARGFLTAVLFAQRGSNDTKTQVFKDVGGALEWHDKWLANYAPDKFVVRRSIRYLRAMVERPS